MKMYFLGDSCGKLGSVGDSCDCSVMAATNLHIYEYYLALIALEMSEMYVMTFKTLA